MQSLQMKTFTRMKGGKSFIITILDDVVEMLNPAAQNPLDSKRKTAARELAGMWASHNISGTVDEMVRTLRKGRHFDF